MARQAAWGQVRLTTRCSSTRVRQPTALQVVFHTQRFPHCRPYPSPRYRGLRGGQPPGTGEVGVKPGVGDGDESFFVCGRCRCRPSCPRSPYGRSRPAARVAGSEGRAPGTRRHDGVRGRRRRRPPCPTNSHLKHQASRPWPPTKALPAAWPLMVRSPSETTESGSLTVCPTRLFPESPTTKSTATAIIFRAKMGPRMSRWR